MNVTAHCTHSNGWWAVEVEEIPGLFTQARRLDQVAAMVRDAASMLGKQVDEVNVEPTMGSTTAHMIQEMSAARQQAKQTQEYASQVSRRTVSTLRSQGLTVRDVAALTGISPQRVAALK